MINNVTLMGRLTFEPELKVTANGISVIRFNIAVDRGYTGQNGERTADFIDCTAWRGTADFISKYFHKGDMIALTGAIQTQNYTDKDGNQRKSVDVVVNNVSFCGSKNGNTTEQPANGYEQPAPAYANAQAAQPTPATQPVQQAAQPTPAAQPVQQAAPTASQMTPDQLAQAQQAAQQGFEEIVDDDDLPF